MNLLLKENYSDTRDNIVEILKPFEFGITCIKSIGQSNEEVWNNGSVYDMVIADLEIDDNESRYFIKKAKNGDHTPVILLSDLIEKRDRIIVKELGVNAVFEKPFDIFALKHEVQRLIRPKENFSNL